MTDDRPPCHRRCTRHGSEEIMPATHGRYCSRCFGRINHMLIQAPELAQHIQGNVIVSVQAGGERVATSNEAPLPFNDTAHADVNEMYALLVHWCETWADYLDVVKPAAAARSWRRQSGTVIGLPATTTPEVAAHEIGRMTRWLSDRLDVILDLAPEDVDEFYAAIIDLVHMNARWPRIQQARYSQMPCPHDDCGKKLAVYPPAFPGDAIRIICDDGHFIPADEYEDHVHTFTEARQADVKTRRAEARRAQARAQSERARAARVTEHLTAKYAGGSER